MDDAKPKELESILQSASKIRGELGQVQQTIAVQRDRFIEETKSLQLKYGHFISQYHEKEKATETLFQSYAAASKVLSGISDPKQEQLDQVSKKIRDLILKQNSLAPYSSII